jgi:hypothetical protein
MGRKPGPTGIFVVGEQEKKPDFRSLAADFSGEKIKRSIPPEIAHFS